MKVKSFSHVRLFATPWTVACQAPPPMGFSRQEYWSGLPFPSPGGLPDPGIEPWSPTPQADSLPSEPPGRPRTASDPFKTQVRSHFCLCKAPKHPQLLAGHQIWALTIFSLPLSKPLSSNFSISFPCDAPATAAPGSSPNTLEAHSHH